MTYTLTKGLGATTCWIMSLIFLPPIPRSHSPSCVASFPGHWHSAVNKTILPWLLEACSPVGTVVSSYQLPQTHSPRIAHSLQSLYIAN